MRPTIPVIDAITAGWDAAFPMFGLKILRIFYALRSKGCEAIHKINIRLYSWKRMKNLAKSSDCATNTDSTATADELLQVGFQIRKSRNPILVIRFLGSLHFNICATGSLCWPSSLNYGSQITNPGTRLLNQTVKSHGIVRRTKYIFTLQWVWNSTPKKTLEWTDLDLKRCQKRRESV